MSILAAGAPAVKIVGVSADSVKIGWESVGGAPEHFVVKRNDQDIATVDGSATSYTDAGLDPGTSYSYVVVAQSAGSELASAPVKTKTKVPPIGSARIDGRYSVMETVLSSNLVNVHPGQPMGRWKWHFLPKCASGLCGGTWSIEFDVGDATGSFAPVGATQGYTGGMRNQSIGWCGTEAHHIDDQKDSATLTIHVTRAKALAGEWIATAFAGKYQEYFPGENGCSSSISKYDVVSTRSG